ncbi:MAG: hypothetical protein ABMA64_13655 [Myxococcota bacterium]
MNREQRRREAREKRKVVPITRTVSADSLRTHGPRRREPDPAWRPTIEMLKATFDEVYPQTIEEWEGPFCQDMNPDKELAIWVAMAERYRNAVARREFTLAEKRDIFGLVLSWSMDKAPSEALAEVKVLGPDEAGEILREFG